MYNYDHYNTSNRYQNTLYGYVVHKLMNNEGVLTSSSQKMVDLFCRLWKNNNEGSLNAAFRYYF